MAEWTDLHTDVPLSNFSLAFKNEAFIADLVCPPVTVGKDSDLYYIYGTEDIKLIDTIRADKDASKGISRTLSTTTYKCVGHGLHELVSAKDRDNADPNIDPDLDAVDGLMELMAISKEYEIATLMTTAGNYSSATYYETLSGGDQWDDPGGTSDPIGKIEAAKGVVFDGCLRPANAIIIPYKVALALSTNPSIVDRIKYTQGTTISAGLTALMSGLEQVIGLRVFIGASAYDAKREGQTGKTLTQLWSDYCVVFYLNPSTSWKQMAFCKNFTRGSSYVNRIPQADLGRGVDKIEVNEPGRISKMVGNTSGYLFQDCLV